MSTARVNITDRAERYRAQNAVTGPRKCVLCGSRNDLGVMHLDGNESHGEPANLAYGCRSCNGKLAAAFKRIGAGRPTNQYNPAKGGVPTFEQYAFAVTQGSRRHWEKGTGWVPGEKDEAGAIIHATPKHKRIEYARRIAAAKSRSNPWPFSRPDARRTTPAHGGIAYHQAKAGKRSAVKSKAVKSVGASSMPDEAALQAGFKQGLSLSDMLRANPAPSKKWGRDIVLYDGDSLETARDYLRGAISGGRYIGLQMFGKKGKWQVTADSVRKSNPAAASAEVFEEFHGFAPSEVVTVTKHIHHHEHLAAAGKLVSLDVWGVDNQGHRISGFKGAFLAFNETKNQLFVEGGDQSIDLADFGIDSPHELETLGRLTDIGYQTNKTHLGDEGGEAVYVHKFRTTNDAGKHVVVKIARYPDLIYDVRNEQLLFSGGSYEILREGINK